MDQARLFQVHVLSVQEARFATSVFSRSNLAGESGHACLHIETQHQASLLANDKIYHLTKLTSPVMFRRGDEMIAVCRQNRDGSFEVLAFVNLSNGTSFTRPYQWALLYAWLMFGFSLMLVMLIVGIVLAPIMLWNAWTMSTVTYPQLREAVEVMMALSAVNEHGERVRRSTIFNETSARPRPPPRRRLFQLDPLPPSDP